eukprot:COSAG01_NODE_1611_length_9738_cov_22.481689_1_plen_343_part_10
MLSPCKALVAVMALGGAVAQNITYQSIPSRAMTPIIQQVAADNTTGTVQLSLNLSSAQATVYTIYATTNSPAMTFPAALQFGGATGSDYGPPLVAISDGSAADNSKDSWLAVGSVTAGQLGSVGINYTNWTTAGLSISDGAVFLTTPSSASGSGTVIAQITTACGTVASATVNAQGASVVGDNWQSEGISFTWKACETGCMDPTASNYNSLALVPDGGCTYSGCTDSTASNFNTSANLNDGSCQYLGCTHSESSDYNSYANTDDGSCLDYFVPVTPTLAVTQIAYDDTSTTVQLSLTLSASESTVYSIFATSFSPAMVLPPSMQFGTTGVDYGAPPVTISDGS